MLPAVKRAIILQKRIADLEQEASKWHSQYHELLGKIETRAREMFNEWRSSELEKQANERAKILFEKWKRDEEKRIREDAIKRSEAALKAR